MAPDLVDITVGVSTATDAKVAGAARGLLGPVSFSAIPDRRLTEDTCRKWRYGEVDKWVVHKVTGEQKLVRRQVAQYATKDGPAIAAQKWRSADKRFGWVGEPKAAETLYGRHLWRDAGRRVVVTEGEIDALSVSQVQENKWPVVSLANGAGSAERAFRDNLEWLEAFQEVVIMFDMDDEGRKAAEAAAQVLSPGKARIALLPTGMKDASDMLQAGRDKELVDAIWGARQWRPDGILAGPDLWARVTAPLDAGGIPCPWSGLQHKIHGLRRRELITVCAGTGIGKSTLARELLVHLIQRGEKVGVIALEESARETVLGMLGILQGKYLRLGDPDWTGLAPTWDGIADRVCVYDHFASLDPDVLLARMRYMAVGLGCGWILLDHLTLAMSGGEDDGERQAIDRLMSRMVKLKEETGIGLLVVSQLKRPGIGPQFEDGLVPKMAHLRGSSSIEQGSNIILALSRDLTKGEVSTQLTVLKNRFSGETGPAGVLEWSLDEGRYREVSLFQEPPA